MRLFLLSVIIGWPLVVLCAGIFQPVVLSLSLVCLLLAVGYTVFTSGRAWRSRIAPPLVALWMVLWSSAMTLLFDPVASIVEEEKDKHRAEIAELAALGAEAQFKFSRRYWLVIVGNPRFDDNTLQAAAPHLRKLPTRTLDLRGTEVTERGLNCLKDLPGLEYVHMDASALSARNANLASDPRDFVLLNGRGFTIILSDGDES